MAEELVGALPTRNAYASALHAKGLIRRQHNERDGRKRILGTQLLIRAPVAIKVSNTEMPFLRSEYRDSLEQRATNQC